MLLRPPKLSNTDDILLNKDLFSLLLLFILLSKSRLTISQRIRCHEYCSNKIYPSLCSWISPLSSPTRACANEMDYSPSWSCPCPPPSTTRICTCPTTTPKSTICTETTSEEERSSSFTLSPNAHKYSANWVQEAQEQPISKDSSPTAKSSKPFSHIPGK